MPKLAWIACIALGCRGVHVGSGSTEPTQSSAAWLRNGRVHVPFEREHYEEYKDDGGLIGSTLVGSHEYGDTTTELETESAGMVVIDIRSGTCAHERTRGKRPRREGSAEVVRLGTTPIATPSGQQVVVAGDEVRVGARVIARVPKHGAYWVRGTDAVLVDNRLIDLTDGVTWPMKVTAIATSGDRVFVATPEHGVLELTAPHLARVATHIPPAFVPRDEAWLPRVEWRDGETIDGVTLLRDPDVLDGGSWRVALGDAGTMYRIGDIAAGNGILVSLATHTTTRHFAKPPRRIAKHEGDLVFDAGNAYTMSNVAFGQIRPFKTPTLRFLGQVGSELVFHVAPRRAVLVFDVTTRSWRDHRYDACTPS